MKFLKYSIEVNEEEPVHLTPYSDVHYNDSNCAIDKWKKHYHQRAKLHNSFFINIGDFNSLIMPNDEKRFRPSGQVIKGVDDIINQEIKTTIELIKSEPNAKWLFWGMGNHEDEILKRHYIHIPKIIAEALNIPMGLYCGILALILKLKRVKSSRIFYLAYHHGAWGGAVIKGLGGAIRYFTGIYPWYVAVFGHNHMAIHDIIPLTIISPYGYIETINRHIVGTGGWLLNYKENQESVSYTERKGYPMAVLTAPLIKIWIKREGKERKPCLYWEVITS